MPSKTVLTIRIAVPAERATIGCLKPNKLSFFASPATGHDRHFSEQIQRARLLLSSGNA